MACAVGPSKPSSSIDFPCKTWFFGIYLNFHLQRSLKNQYLPHFGIQILPNKFHQILLIKNFSTTSKAHSNSLEILSYNLIWFSVKKSFNIQELLHCKSKRHGTKPMHPSLLRACQRHQEHNLKHPRVRWIS